MAVAEKPTTKTGKGRTAQNLAIPSLAGAIFIVAGLSFALSGIPALWGPDYLNIDAALDNPYLSTSLIMFLSAITLVGLVFAGRMLEGPNPAKGVRAGSVIAAFYLFFTFIVAVDWVGGSMAARGTEATITWAVIIAIAALMVFLLYWVYTTPGFAKFLVKQEENGWFHATSFKYNQGQKLRRATLIAFLVVIGFGLFTNLRTGLFGRGDWEVLLPGFPDTVLVVLYNSQFMFPLLIFAIFGWLAWRSVNWPTFADFLIATEAEMNKVSWSTKKRLFQDTIVVLVTVVLFTFFLFFVDVLWVKVLSFEPIPGVLKINPQAEKLRQRGSIDW